MTEITRKLDGRCGRCDCVSVCTVTDYERVLDVGTAFEDYCRNCRLNTPHSVVVFLTGLERLQEASE